MKEKLIHWLGGYTEQELQKNSCSSAQVVRYSTLIEVQSYMREINGEDADTWCNLAWKYVTSKIEEMTTF